MTTWDELPNGTEDIREAFAAELGRMGLTANDNESISIEGPIATGGWPDDVPHPLRALESFHA